MTLSTDIYVTTPASPLDVWVKVCAALGLTHPMATAGPKQSWNDDGVHYYVIANRPGQGAPAWVHVYARYDGQPITPDGDDDQPGHWVRVNLDTAYHGRVHVHGDVIRALDTAYPYGSVTWRDESTGLLNEGVHGIDAAFGRAVR